MKKKYSNYIFFGYLAIIFLIGLGSIIYLRIALNGKITKSETDFHTNVNMNIKDQMKEIPKFNVLIVKNQAEVTVIESDSFAANVDASDLQFVNDTLIISSDDEVALDVKSLKKIIVGDEAELQLVSFKTSDLYIDASNETEVNIVGPYLATMTIAGRDQTEINITAAHIDDLKVDLSGETELSIQGDVVLLEGSKVENAKISAFPKPKNVDLEGKGL